MKNYCFHSLMRLAVPRALLLAGLALLAGPGSSQGATAALPQTGQTSCFDVSGNQLDSCTGTGQDGEDQSGVAWSAPRFVANADGTVTDVLTGLAWSADANAPGPAACTPGTTKTWPAALSYVSCLNAAQYLGHADWRLPNIKELWSLFNAGEGTISTWLANNSFRNVQMGRYKSSTVLPGDFPVTPLVMDLGDGSLHGFAAAGADHVWPVRTAQPAGAVQLLKTGATRCYDLSSSSFGACGGTGQDGELQRGMPWSTATRFSVGTDQVSDTLTGLQWARQGSALNFQGCSGGKLNWGAALQFVRCLNDNQYQGKNDWRLPNLNELASLSNAGSDIFPWLTTPPLGFQLDASLAYWSSSTYLQQTDSAWSVGLGQSGAVFKVAKGTFGNVLPVRTGAPAAPFGVGDVNRDGVVDIKDALLIYQLYLARASQSFPVDASADVGPLGNDGKPVGDGVIDLGDVITILRYLAFQGSPGAVQW